MPVQSNAKVDNNIAGKENYVTDKQSPVPIVPVVASSPARIVISTQGGVTPVLTYAETKTVSATNQASPVKTIKNEEVQNISGPATQLIPAGSLKSGATTQAPVTTASAKSVEVDKNSNAGTLATIPTLTLASSMDITPAVVNPASSPQQIQGQPKAAEPVVTPPSVINTAKTPVKQN